MPGGVRPGGELPSRVSRLAGTQSAGWPAERPLPVFISNKSFWPIPKAPAHASPPPSSLHEDFSKPAQVVAKLFLGRLFSKDLSDPEACPRRIADLISVFMFSAGAFL